MSRRVEYLLDLACSDIHNATVSVHPSISDHKALLVKLPLPVILEKLERREVWILKEANWTQLKRDLEEYDWAILHEGATEKSLDTFLEILWLHLVKYIPRRPLDITKVTSLGQ